MATYADLLLQRLSRLPNYVQRFGVRHGVRLLVGNEKRWAHVSDRERSFKVPGYAFPIRLRDTVSDHAIFWQCVVRDQYDLERFPHYTRLLARYREVLAAGRRPLIIDAGGNIGLSAIWFARAFPESQVVVLEPDAENFKLLSINVAPYGERIKAIRAGVWGKSAWLEIIDPEAGASAIQVRETDQPGATSIRAYCVGDLLEDFAAAEPLIVKMDVEGSQKWIFDGDTRWLSRVSAVVLELDDWLLPWQGTSRSFFKALSSMPSSICFPGN